MINEISTGKILKLIETDDINKVPFNAGQFIMVDDGTMYYDSTIGKTIDDRLHLTPKHEVDVYERENKFTDEYYLSLQTRPIFGDIVIIKDLIPGSDKYSTTIYLYNDNTEDTNTNNWVKLSDSYNSDKVYFDKDLAISLDIPGIELTNGKKIINSTGKNLSEIFDIIFYPEKNPIITKPSIHVDFPEAGYYEIGTVITPTYNIKFNSGNYEFGPNTDVVVNEYEITSSDGFIKNTKTGSFSAITVDENTNFYLTGIVYHSAGTVPVTNKNNEYNEGQLMANGILDISPSITGYLNGMYYGTSDEILTETDITSDIIKGLNKTDKAYDVEPVDMTIPVGTKSIIIACPNSETGIVKVFNHTANCDMIGAFGQPFVKKVMDASNSLLHAKKYNVWIYTPAEPYEFEANLTIICK